MVTSYNLWSRGEGIACIPSIVTSGMAVLRTVPTDCSDGGRHIVANVRVINSRQRKSSGPTDGIQAQLYVERGFAGVECKAAVFRISIVGPHSTANSQDTDAVHPAHNHMQNSLANSSGLLT